MLEDLLHNSDGFGVVERLLRRPTPIKARQLSPASGEDSYRYQAQTFYPYEPLPFDNIFDDMSITRQLFNEFRPFFRMFDDAAFRPLAVAPRHHRHRDVNDPFQAFFGAGMGSSLGRAANVEMTEEANEFIVEAELPGVKKENLEVTVGDNGRSITIEGKVFARSSGSPDESQGSSATNQESEAGARNECASFIQP